MSEKNILRLLTALGFISLPFLFRKQPAKDWILVFSLKAFYSGFLDSFVVRYKKVEYPVRLLPKVFDIHIVFDLLLFPIACVVYNQVTYRTNLKQTIGRVFLFSIPMALVESVVEKKTNLLKFKKNWNAFYSFLSLTFTFWLVRATIGLIRKYDNL